MQMTTICEHSNKTHLNKSMNLTFVDADTNEPVTASNKCSHFYMLVI